MKTFVIGDIHGGYKALVQCLERSGFNYDKDQLITLGDIADGWPQVPEVVEELLKIKNRIDLIGNHDDWTLQWMKFLVANPMWLEQGGQATYDAYTVYHPDLITKHQQEFFEKQHYYYIDDQNRLFIHAGFTHMRGPTEQVNKSELIWDRSLWEVSLAIRRDFGKHGFESQHFPKRLRLFKEIFIGHTSTTTLTQNQIRAITREMSAEEIEEMTMMTVDFPVNNANLWNLDTGGGWGGKLTIMDVNSKEFWQSDTVSDLYPDHTGRR